MDEDPRVLVIDDDEALRELVIRVVKQAGYQVDAVGDGPAGLERLAERQVPLVYRDSDGLQLPRVVVERETLNGCTRNRLLHVVPQAARSIRDWTFRVPTEEARSPLDVRGVRTERHAFELEWLRFLGECH
jgi:hypothetical protein